MFIDTVIDTDVWKYFIIFHITNVKTVFLNSKGKKLQKRNHVDEYVAKMINTNLKSESALDTWSGLDTLVKKPPNKLALFPNIFWFICNTSNSILIHNIIWYIILASLHMLCLEKTKKQKTSECFYDKISAVKSLSFKAT